MRLALVALAACSVPDLDVAQKSCPCATGYTCVSNKCIQTAGDGGAGSCLGTVAGTELTSGQFASWTNVSGAWGSSGSAFVQTNATDNLALAYTSASGLDTRMTYRVVATMTMNGAGMGAGIAVRVGGNKLYACLWEPGQSSALALDYSSNGNTLTPFTSAPLGNFDPAQMTTMEFLADGTSLHCCIDGLSAANVSVLGPTPLYAMGFAGLVTNQRAATFQAFTAYDK